MFRRILIIGSLLILSVLLTGCPSPGTPPPPPPTQTTNRSESVLFEDEYAASGIQFVIKKQRSPLNILETIGHGVGLFDADGDGRIDILLLAPDKVVLYKNQGEYHFQDISAGSGLRQPGYWTGVAVGDYDNDGKPDLYLSGYNASALYHNEGGGHFKAVTEQAGLSAHPPSADIGDWRTSAGFADLDNDGKLDLYVCCYAEFGPKSQEFCGDKAAGKHFSCSPEIYTPLRGSLYRNLGNGQFQDITEQAGLNVASGRALGVAFADYNDDGRLDIALANDVRPGDLFENRGGLRFVNQGVASGTAFDPLGHPHGGMGIDWADYDGDGHPDLFVATYEKEAKSLYRNLGTGFFADVGLDANLSDSMSPWVMFGSRFLDYDNDGRPDLMVTSGHVLDNTAAVTPGTAYRQPVQLFRNDDGKRFEEATARLGSKARTPIVGRGLAVGDLNNSGWLDVVITNLDGSPMLLRNRAQNGHHWITVRLVGTKSNRDGIGARVTVRAGGRTQVCDASSSGSYLTANDPRLHFGLGRATQVESVTVRWPSGHTDIYRGLRADTIYRLTEGRPTPGTEQIETAASH